MADPTPTPEIHNAHGGYESKIIQLQDEAVDLEICQTCHYIEAHCRHAFNSWNADRTVLTCDFCGIDGT